MYPLPQGRPQSHMQPPSMQMRPGMQFGPPPLGGGGFEAAEDWRMAIVWGRTLVALADEKVTCEMNAAKSRSPNALPGTWRDWQTQR